jgi:HPt (histidine-containing phosphotransfer) domain-containing protein
MSLGPEARARLQARFLAGLPDRLDVMLAVAARLGAGDPTALDEGRRLGHQLAGTGASFGYPELSERGRELERASNHELRPALDRLIACVRATLQRAEPPTPTPRREG